jgi:TolB-like protein/class 3 adenylate cyclase
MAATLKSDPHLEIAHVLFIDVVGYSKLLVNEQREVVQQLNEAVRAAPQFSKSSAAGKLIRIPTGDGMALVFFQSPEEPAQCAMEIARALKNDQQIRLRMGVHSGPVDQIKDVNDRSNVAGAGINIAQRVMDCGDAGHILLSKRVAEDLKQDRHWHPHLHELGEIELKHGERVGIVNLYTEELGNSHPPEKLSRRVAAAKEPVAPFGVVRDVPEKSIAVLPFENLSADPENAFFVDGVHDEILTDLARIADLKVISRTSVMQYKTGIKRSVREIAGELGVAHIVEGSVQRAGNRVRLRAQLIDARTDVHLWRKNSIGRWMMSLPSRARLPKQSRTNFRRNFHQRRSQPLSSRQRLTLSPTIGICAARVCWLGYRSTRG